MKTTRNRIRAMILEIARRKIIREEKSDRRPWGSYAHKSDVEFRDVIIMSPNGDSLLVDGMETYLYDVPRQLEAVSGFPMKGNDPDNLIFALEQSMLDGYVELEVTYQNGEWGW